MVHVYIDFYIFSGFLKYVQLRFTLYFAVLTVLAIHLFHPTPFKKEYICCFKIQIHTLQLLIKVFLPVSVRRKFVPVDTLLDFFYPKKNTGTQMSKKSFCKIRIDCSVTKGKE